jgi:hypothetical protein
MRWNRSGFIAVEILYLADRNILIDDPEDRCSTFGVPVGRSEQRGQQGREMLAI